jgi:hypothetical protein
VASHESDHKTKLPSAIEVEVQLFANERREAYGMTALRGQIWLLRCYHRLPSLMLAYRPFGRMVTSEYFLKTVGYEESSPLLHLDALISCPYLSSGEAYSGSCLDWQL